jgi:hypothetical protein
MKLNVTENNVKIIQKELYNSGEYNIHSCEFVFSAEYENLIKKALFTNKNQKTYRINIINNRCQIPTEVLKEKGNIEIGVYAYEVQDEELVLRYSPKPATFYVDKGSYKENAENSTPPTPTEVEQIEQEILNVSQNFNNYYTKTETENLINDTFNTVMEGEY